MPKTYTIMFWVSMALVAVSIVFLALYGLNFGVDFKGGSVLELEFAQTRPSAADMDNTLKSISQLHNPSVSPVGDRNIIIRADELSEANHQKVLAHLDQAFPDGKIQELRFDSVGPVIGGELKHKSLVAIIVVLLAVAAYIAFVFRTLSRTLSPWAMSLATLVALAHDITIPLGTFALLGRLLNVEISAVFVAAILTVLGYSISDTVVVFDRVRENVIRGGLAKAPFPQIVHTSIMQTLVRSLNTTFTTLLSLVAIFLFGGDSIKYFALALMIGIASGSYSSIFVASPLLVWLSRKRK